MSGRGKRRRTDSLPALETVFQQCSSTKSQVMESFSRLAQVDFQCDYCLPESAKLCCLFARFSVEAVMKVAHCVLSVPTGITEHQRNQLVAIRAGVSLEDARTSSGSSVPRSLPLSREMLLNSCSVLQQPLAMSVAVT